jgi:cytochrome c oxidase subunit I
VDDPWGTSRSLEWATSCPPPRHNFDSLPRIRSESPAFDLHHPELAAMNQVSPQDDSPGRKIFGDAERGEDHDTDEFAHTEDKRDS